MKKILLLCICLAFTFISKAQTADKKWNIGLHGGVTQYQGDLGNNFYRFVGVFEGIESNDDDYNMYKKISDWIKVLPVQDN